MFCAAAVVTALVLCPGGLGAQTQPVAVSAGSAPAAAAALPEAPQPQSTASLTGTVLNGGKAVPGTQVSIISQDGSVTRIAGVDGRGAYTFSGLPPGRYTVTVNAPGMQPVSPEQMTLTSGQSSQLPIVVQPIPRFTSTVRVTATTTQIATAQVHLQEKQRVLGVLPNFYTNYEWDAAPMTTKLKFQLWYRSLIDPFTFVTVAGVAGAEQWRNIYPGYGTGATGYGKRFGAALADTTVSRIIGDAALPTLFHQDPRYFYLGSGGVGERFGYAVKESVMCRGDDGHQEFNYSHVLGSFLAAALSNVYHNPQDRTFNATMRDGLVITGSNAIENLLREFVSRKLSSNVPKTANGKP